MTSLYTAQEFFDGNPPPFLPGDTNTPDWDELRRKTASSPGKYPVEKLRYVLRDGNTHIGASPETLGRIDAMSDRTLFVVAGQQAGLFGGPLYTIYKALHAVRLADRLSEETGLDVLPVFWIASDDHDFEEVSRLGIRSTGSEAATVSCRPETYRKGMPVGDIMLDENIRDTVDTLIDSMPGGDRRDWYADLLGRSWQPGSLWADAFAQELAGLTAGTGLVMLDPRWRDFKSLLVPVMEHELHEPLISTMIINAEANAFDTASGRKKALRKNDTATNLFFEADGIREQLRYENGVFIARDITYSKDEITSMLRSEPGRFSPAAGLRPVCQDAVMPVAAMIAGPGERRYLAQIPRVYSHFGIAPSIVWPRASFTLIDNRITRTADKEGVTLQRLFDPPEQLAAGLATDSFPPEIDSEFERLRSGISDGIARLAGRLGTIDQSLVAATEKERGRLLHTLDGLKEKALRAHKRTVSISRERFATATGLLRPNGMPQERWFGTDLLLSLTGPDGFAGFASLTSPGEEHHRILAP